jgi:hypothetical protein
MKPIYSNIVKVAVCLILLVLLNNCTTTDGFEGGSGFKKDVNDGKFNNSTILATIRNIGYPSYYEYYSESELIILYYNIIQTGWYLFGITERIYLQYQFHFNLDKDNILNSKLSYSKYLKALGKNYIDSYAMNEISYNTFNAFLENIVKQNSTETDPEN